MSDIALSALNALSFNPHDKGDGSIVIPIAQKTKMKLREVKKCTQDATAQGRSQGSKSGVGGFQPCTLRYGAVAASRTSRRGSPPRPLSRVCCRNSWWGHCHPTESSYIRTRFRKPSKFTTRKNVLSLEGRAYCRSWLCVWCHVVFLLSVNEKACHRGK